MGNSWEVPLEKIDEYRWKIPQSFMPGMKVPGIVYADGKLLKDIRHDKALQQVANAACLPGIVKNSFAMPDVHWGYGLCLAKDAEILTGLGFYKPISDFEKDWANQSIRSIDLNSKKPVETSISRFIKLKTENMFRLVTKSGYEIKATGDHPLFTSHGMKPIKELSPKKKVAIFPFQGVPYARPSDEIIISEKDIRETLLKLGRKPRTPKFEIILQRLRKRNILSLTYDHPKLPYILKIMAFVFGDASMNFIGKRGDGVLHFAGKPQDLEEVRSDLEKIGYTASPVHFQKRKPSQDSDKYCDCYSFLVNASSLVVLLESLGVPRGSKVNQSYRIPKWIYNTPLWQKRLFLASLFGCELRTPHKRLDRRGYFNAPVFPMAKREKLVKNGKDFLQDISRLLKEFGVRTLYIDKRKSHVNTRGEISWALELIISPKPENLLNLWGQIGFEYNRERFFMASAAIQYIKLKKKILTEKDEAIKIVIPRLLKENLSYRKIALQLAGNPLTERFIVDICWKLNKGREVIPRIPGNFPLFENYLKESTKGLGQSGMVWSEIEKIEKISYKDIVYDFTVSHSDHNFIADNFVVSNCIGGVVATDVEAGGVVTPGGIGFDICCGVRTMRTNLTEKDVRLKLDNLITTLFQRIPSGVGSKSDIKVSEAEERKIMIRGARWAVEKGFGTKEDLECTEDTGCMEGADPGHVSERAFERGKKQSGTLGSGNHFLEVQVVDEVYDKEAASVFGIDKGSITVMIHCGSRGFGHQICDDYAKGMVRSLARFNINVPDRQLACVPVKSDEGKAYIAAMKCAANYAWNNRQCLMHGVREVFERVFEASRKDLGMSLIWDVAHNIAKFEKYTVNGEEKLLCVHRKGATRAFGPGNPAVPEVYRKIGQPVIIPGDMGRNSYILLGTKRAEEETFGSTCHGAGRLMSRKAALDSNRRHTLLSDLASKGIKVMAAGRGTLAEEAPYAYKNVNDVVDVVHNAGISKKVCRMKPVGVIKG